MNHANVVVLLNLQVDVLIWQEVEDADSDEDWKSSKAADSDTDEDMEFEDEDGKNLHTGPSPAHELAAVRTFIIVAYCDLMIGGFRNH